MCVLARALSRIGLHLRGHTMGFLESALELASKGFHVFPIKGNAKAPPLILGFPDQATRDEATIRGWWEQWPSANIGISTSRFADNEALVVVDVDNKDGKNGSEEILSLELEGKTFPKTFTQTTPTGGYHLVYKAAAMAKQGSGVLASAIDIRSRGGYIVAAGSRIQDSEYRHDNFVVSNAPDWLIERLQCGKDRESFEPKEIEGVNKGAAYGRAQFYLQNEAPHAIEGQGGDQITFQVACRVKDFGVSLDDCVYLMWDKWNDYCQPKWSISELRVKAENAYRYGKEPVGIASPQADFTPIEDDEVEEELPKKEDEIYLGKINEEYALVYMGGSHFILHETIDAKGRKTHNLLTEQTFKRRFSPYNDFSKEKPLPYAVKWLNWKLRREYAGLCFTPEQEPQNNFYNLWRGFAVKPTPYSEASDDAKRGFDLFSDHLLNNVCRGDSALAEWLTGYFAHMIQKPYEKPLTTVVFRGSKGTGKNALIDRLGRLLGSGHYLVAHDGRYLTSNFNGHLDSCLCLVLDEAFWSGDKAAEGKLKGLTTAPEILIERKGKEPYMVDNLVRIIVIGNESWLVPASNDERRYAIFDIGEGKKQNLQYFEDMRVFMDDRGGSEVLLHYLKNFDLSKVNVNRAPQTEALLDQKLESLDRFHKFWFECLNSERIIESHLQGWPGEVSKQDFHEAYGRFIKNRQMGKWVEDVRLIGRLLKTCCPSVVNNQKGKDETGNYVRVYKLPDLTAARKEWEAFVGQKMAWD